MASERLSELRLPWALLGGLAVSIRTEPRFTRDVDIGVAVHDDAGAESAVLAFRKEGFEVNALVEQDAAHRLATVRLSAPERLAGGLLLDLLFASSGIEPEICAAAEKIQIFDGLAAPVARAEHLLALKILARDDKTRPQDAVDIAALLKVMDGEGLAVTRQALRLITERGFHRDRALEDALDAAVAQFGPSS